MRILLLKAFLACVFGSFLGVIATGQSGPQADGRTGSDKKVSRSASSDKGNLALDLAGKVTIVIIKSAANTAWVTTKFAAKDVAKPIIVGIAKPLLLKATPQITMFALKLTGNSLKKGIPIATKLGMTYLRAKLPI